MADITKITTKGQIVLPQNIRKKLLLDDSDALQIERVGNLLVLKKINLQPLEPQLIGGRK